LAVGGGGDGVGDVVEVVGGPLHGRGFWISRTLCCFLTNRE
jgi:hypothetical protein